MWHNCRGRGASQDVVAGAPRCRSSCQPSDAADHRRGCQKDPLVRQIGHSFRIAFDRRTRMLRNCSRDREVGRGRRQVYAAPHCRSTGSPAPANGEGSLFPSPRGQGHEVKESGETRGRRNRDGERQVRHVRDLPNRDIGIADQPRSQESGLSRIGGSRICVLLRTLRTSPARSPGWSSH
jgi:hypothetical protein